LARDPTPFVIAVLGTEVLFFAWDTTLFASAALGGGRGGSTEEGGGFVVGLWVLVALDKLENFLFATGDTTFGLEGDVCLEGLVKSGSGSAPVSV
jgi:hypothetical protein